MYMPHRTQLSPPFKGSLSALDTTDLSQRHSNVIGCLDSFLEEFDTARRKSQQIERVGSPISDYSPLIPVFTAVPAGDFFKSNHVLEGQLEFLVRDLKATDNKIIAANNQINQAYRQIDHLDYSISTNLNDSLSKPCSIEEAQKFEIIKKNCLLSVRALTAQRNSICNTKISIIKQILFKLEELRKQRKAQLNCDSASKVLGFHSSLLTDLLQNLKLVDELPELEYTSKEKLTVIKKIQQQIGEIKAHFTDLCRRANTVFAELHQNQQRKSFINHLVSSICQTAQIPKENLTDLRSRLINLVATPQPSLEQLSQLQRALRTTELTIGRFKEIEEEAVSQFQEGLESGSSLKDFAVEYRSYCQRALEQRIAGISSEISAVESRRCSLIGSLDPAASTGNVSSYKSAIAQLDSLSNKSQQLNLQLKKLQEEAHEGIKQLYRSLCRIKQTRSEHLTILMGNHWLEGPDFKKHSTTEQFKAFMAKVIERAGF